MEQIFSFLTKFSLVLLAIIAPIKATMIALGFLMFADLILGIMAARKRGEIITSAGLWRSVVKLFVLQVGLVTAFVVETYLAQELFPIVKTFSALVSIVELVSIFENINTITGTNMLGKLVDALKSKNDDTLKPKE